MEASKMESATAIQREEREAREREAREKNKEVLEQSGANDQNRTDTDPADQAPTQ
jgi:hypothetical protein